ncbi:hypothetical protein J4E82_006527 [Alternaria postmessia]|uniref:uncharacterized protein n=1 Tax=Alternaria postmessia TaxID=1187938 RepID=UPI0022246EFD|nr:uncharacterized protein J4E82_006527 [Alternaria postmessia]KAI5374659.1 hypothetical protein J4E82_006527 [Alternaria postmessia]
MKKQTTIKNFFLKRPSLDAAQDDTSSKRPKPDSQTVTPTTERADETKVKEITNATDAHLTIQKHIQDITNILPTLRADGDRLVYESLQSELQQRLEEQRQNGEADTTREEEGTMSEAVATQSALPTAKRLSPSPSAGNTSNPNRVAIQPFKERATWVCPYKAIGRCSHPKGYFPKFKELTSHVRLKHAKNELVTPYAIDPMPDGTLKIPCPPCIKYRSLCLPMERTQWVRGPYQCHKDECGGFFADLYELAMHESRCKGDGSSPERRTSYRFALTSAAREGEPPSVIVVNRSSAKAPGSWKDGTDSLQDGLPNIGKKYLAHYAAWTTFDGAAVIHSCYDVATRYLPSPAVDDSFTASSQSYRIKQHRAFVFTQAIVNDIEAANQAGIRPTILSVGADGWFCDAKAIVPWLQATILKFDLVLYLNCLPNGISTKFADEHYGAWWIRYDPQLILKALESGFGLDEKADELIAAWKILQDSKDSSFGKSYGRNHINPNTLFPILE